MKKRPLTLLWVVYALLVLYGSLMPFDFEFNMALFREHIERAFTFWPFGATFPGKADIVSNIILYIPLGLLVAAAGRVNHNDKPAWCIISATAIGAALSMCVESLQAFSEAARVAGLHDFATNIAGSLCGGILGAAYGKEAFRFIIIKSRRYWRNNPCALVAGLMAFFIAFDAWFPFMPTIKRQELANNIKNSITGISAGLDVHTTSYWIIKKIGVFAIVAMLLTRAFDRLGAKKFIAAVIAGGALAVVCECGKIFISNRFFNSANVATAVIGVLIGALLARMTATRISLSGKIALAAVSLAMYIIYIQLEGQEFNFAGTNIADKLPTGIEALPMYDYAMSGRGEKVILFIRTVGLTAALTFTLQLLRHTRTYRPSLIKWIITMAIFGAILEGFQLFIPDRYPSSTDVFCFALGGLVGSILTMLSPIVVDLKKIEHSHSPRNSDVSDKLLYLKHTRQ